MMNPAAYQPAQPMQQAQPNQLDPELMKYLLENYGDMLRSGQVNQQMQQAQALRNAAPQRGMVRGARGMDVPASPLSGLANVAQTAFGAYQQKKAMDEQSEINRRIADRVGQYGSAILSPGVQAG